MPKIFLETTALIDLFFKAKKDRRFVEESIPAAAAASTSQYVVYELAKGYLRYLILVFNKTASISTFSALCRYCNSMRRKSYFQGAMWDYFAKFFEESKFDKPDHLTMDVYQLVLFRAFLRRDIRRGWRAQQKIARIPDAVGCREHIPAPELDTSGEYQQELNKRLCGKVDACGVKHYFASFRKDFEGLHDELAKLQSPDDETKKRIKALRSMYRVRKTDFRRTDCYECADAIICHEAPADHTIITTNHRHWGFISQVFGKKVCAPPSKKEEPEKKLEETPE